jgi:branched-chain amino acid transport system permease protein
VVQAIWGGLVLGAVYALVADGLVLSLLPSGAFNFAQGAIFAGGMYTAYLWLHTLGLPELVAILLNLIVGAALGVACEIICIRPLRWRREGGAAGQTELITTVGMSVALLGLITLIWGVNPLNVPFHGPSKTVEFLGAFAAPIEIIVVVMAIIVPIVLELGFRFTRVGQACLALAEDREAASLRGINVNWLSVGGFAAAGMLAGLASALVGPVTFADQTEVSTLALGGFVAVALGGGHNLAGTAAGGFLVGIVSSLAVRYLGSNYDQISVFAVLILTFTLRPRGFGGLAEIRRV